MQIIVISNIYSFHEIDVFEQMITKYGANLLYLTTEDMPEERKRMKYKNESKSFVKDSRSFKDEELKQLFKPENIVILGSCLDPRVYKYMSACKNIIFSCEHILKSGSLKNHLSRLKFFAKTNMKYRNNEKYVLSFSSYAGAEFNKFGFNPKNIYKFGYFPKIAFANTKDISEKDPFQIIWTGRMVSWKHPEIALMILKKMKSYNSKYHLVFVGEGPEKQTLLKMVEKLELEQSVEFKPFCEHDEIMNLFKKSGVFAFTSDKNEGWGVVLNEALSQGCIVFANKMAGSTNFLVKDQINGFTYKSKKELDKQLASFIKMNKNDVLQIRMNAIETISKTWNSDVAAERLNILVNNISENKDTNQYLDGPISKYL